MIPREEIVGVLHALADHPEEVSDVAARDPDVSLKFRGWSLFFFDDAGDLDYLDSAYAPDGRRGEFDDWYTNRDPIDELSRAEKNRIAAIFGLLQR
jgi:hypothetical protein